MEWSRRGLEILFPAELDDFQETAKSIVRTDVAWKIIRDKLV